ncbi:hypothetical protein MsAg5_03130 [Methanosarcinaceae archaeon Ag5]|uniref:DNA primase DnaG n=1 Tax=Methanolapillus africanus TaxID=3028297 RepID=A0AAE4MHW0_9EURY|nr:hypothetical protein [Methanosarcinaceae archaeon Ag5]
MQNADTTKYIIQTKINADGVIERPDIVGAIFGQTEGLLGNDLDLRELQKTGRIGRIEVMVTTKGGKTRGNIFIPSSLDKVKTSVLAASLETIDRVGPCLATIEVMKIEDVRAAKRTNIIERAKEIYKTMFDEDLLEAQEITDLIRESVRVEGITHYGKGKLPAGPEYDSSEIIIVEGRADVLNLLKYGIKNTISVGGTNIPPEVVDLVKGKTVTVFTDGDRGGELIIRELIQVAKVDFVARPPDGKAVEDLVQKEIIMSLRRKMPLDQYVEKYGIILPSKRPGKNVVPRGEPRAEVRESGREQPERSVASKLLEKKTPKRVAKIRQTAMLVGGKKPVYGDEAEDEIFEEDDEQVRNVRAPRDVQRDAHREPEREVRGKRRPADDLDGLISIKYVDMDEEHQENGEASQRRRLEDYESRERKPREPQSREFREPREPREPRAPRQFDRESRNGREDSEFSPEKREEKPKSSLPPQFENYMTELSGTLGSKILDQNDAVLCNLPVRDLATSLKKGIGGAKTIVFDGVVTQRIIDIAAEQGIEKVVGLKMGNIVKMPTNIDVLVAQK